MLRPASRKYLLTALAGTPDVLDGLLQAVPTEDARWDNRPDPERFTLREIVAHLADWNPIFLDRLARTRDEAEPVLEDCDEGRIAIDHDYAHSDPHAGLKRFREGRAALLDLLRALPEDAWQRIGHRPPLLGPLTMEAQAVVILGHDGYHTQQVAQWLAAARA